MPKDENLSVGDNVRVKMFMSEELGDTLYQIESFCGCACVIREVHPSDTPDKKYYKSQNFDTSLLKKVV